MPDAADAFPRLTVERLYIEMQTENKHAHVDIKQGKEIDRVQALSVLGALSRPANRRPLRTVCTCESVDI